MSGVVWSGLVNDYRVKFVDGSTVDVRASIVDAIRWEKNNNGRSIVREQTVSSMLSVIWYAMRRQQLTDVKDFDQFLATVDDFGSVSEDEAVDPSSPDLSGD